MRTIKEGFPSELLRAEQSALCLFCAAFGGVQDVKFLSEAGLRDVLLVDNDAEKALNTSKKYGYRFHIKDAFDDIVNLAAAGCVYDVVVCDQWTPQDKMINEDYLEKLLAITREHLIIGCSNAYLSTLKEWPEGEYYKRSDFTGGVYWRVISKTKKQNGN